MVICRLPRRRRYESLEGHELGDDASGSGSHGQTAGDGGLRGAELLAELKREVTKQVIVESRQVRARCWVTAYFPNMLNVSQ
jgi:hypothetical protein